MGWGLAAGTNPCPIGSMTRRLPRPERHRGRWRQRVMIAGKRTSRMFDTEAEAVAWADRMIRQGEPGFAHSLGAAFDRVMTNAEARRVRPATAKAYREQARQIFRCIPRDTSLAEISADVIREFVAERNREVSGATVAYHLKVLGWMLREAVRANWIARSPMDDLGDLAMELGKRHRAKRYQPFGAAQLTAVLRRMRKFPHRLGKRDADIVEVMWSTGLRRREFADLRVRDVDPFAGRISVDGKRSDSVIFVDGPAKEALARLAQGRMPDQLLTVRPTTLDAVFARWSKLLGIRGFHAHALRHGGATHLAKTGHQLLDVQAFLRHATPSQTARYFHADEESKRRTARGLHLPGDQPGDQQPDAETGS